MHQLVNIAIIGTAALVASLLPEPSRGGGGDGAAAQGAATEIALSLAPRS